MTDSPRHERAREQSIAFMVQATRDGDYVEALEWLNTLAMVDVHFDPNADAVLDGWRRRAARMRAGERDPRDERPRPGAADYRGLFAALLEQAYDGIVISAISDGWILECSRSWEAMTGFARAEMLGRSSLELGLIEERVRSDAVQRVRTEGSTGLHRTPLRRRDGSIRTIEFSSQLLSGDELLLSIARDVS